MSEQQKQTRAEILEELNRPTDPAILERLRQERRAREETPLRTLGRFVTFGVLVILAIYGISECADGPSPAELERRARLAATRAGEETLRRSLRDPASARVRGVRAIERNGEYVVCGFVNAKNAFGAYSGEQPFVVSRGRAVLLESLTEARHVVAFEACL